MITSKACHKSSSSKKGQRDLPLKNAALPLRRDTIVANEGLKKQIETHRALSKNHSKIQVGLIPQSQLGLIRQDSVEKLARYQPTNPFNGIITFDRTKNQTQTFKNLQEEFSRPQENTKHSKPQRTMSNAKQRPPLTDRTNILNQKNAQQSVKQQQQLIQQRQGKVMSNNQSFHNLGNNRE